MQAAGASRVPPSLARWRRAGLWTGGSGDLVCGLQPCGARPWGEGGGQVRLGSMAVCLLAGGAISLLALNGLFILIHKHNL